MAPSNAPWIVHRRIKLNAAAPADFPGSVPGMLGFEQLGGGRWIVTYDVRVVQFATIAAALETAQPAGWCWRWLIGWRQFQDVNSRDGLLAKEGPCCNRPPRRR